MSVSDPPVDLEEQATKVLSHAGGYVGLRTLDIGLRFHLLAELARHPSGITPADLAEETGLDPFYVEVWCRAAYATDLLELEGDQPSEHVVVVRSGQARIEHASDQAYTLAPHMDQLLLDEDFPGYLGGIPRVLTQPEIFDVFADNLRDGDSIWWDDCNPTFIDAVGVSSRPFYTRLIEDGYEQVPGLSDKLDSGARVLELACGTGRGLIQTAERYPDSTFVGVDGDAHSLDVAAAALEGRGLHERVSLEESMLEEMDFTDEFDVVTINISMHECRNIERVTDNVHRALTAGGYFVNSDFPFPRTLEDCRTVPAQIMCGIQFFEALIGDQLLPPEYYVELFTEHGFHDVGVIELAPVHAVIYGQK